MEWLAIIGDPAVWQSMGFVVADDGTIPLPGTSLRIVARDGDSPAEGIVGWTLSGTTAAGEAGRSDAQRDVDGLATAFVEPADPMYAAHAIGATGLDHVVVMTPDLERTSAAIAEATGCELKRIREVGSMRQGFHRVGPGGLIVELVERPEIPDGPAAFWGLVVNVADIDAACDQIGAGRVSPPKDAVQPGRRIATVSAEVGLGLPVALMTT